MSITFNSQVHSTTADRIIEYKAGEKQSLCNKNVLLGEGGSSRVFAHRSDERLAVKVAIDRASSVSLRHQFEIGRLVDCPFIMKTEYLFCKVFPNNSKIYKLVMPKLHGTFLERKYEKGEELSKEEQRKFLTQGQECCHYLLERNIGWKDLNPGNLCITEPDHNLMICDFDLWTKPGDFRTMRRIFDGSVELTFSILNLRAHKLPENPEPCLFCELFSSKVNLEIRVLAEAPPSREMMIPFCYNINHTLLFNDLETYFIDPRSYSRQEIPQEQKPVDLIDHYFNEVISRL